MNAERRKRLEAVIGLLEQAKDTLSGVREEEQSAYDNLPESLQNGDQGEKMQVAVDECETAETSIEEAIDSITTAKE